MVQLPDFNRGVLEGLGLAGGADVLNPRSLASAVSPALSGALLSTSFAGLPLVVCGVLKIVYDLSLLFSFRHIRPPEEKERLAEIPC
jgi:hypothetical protein